MKRLGRMLARDRRSFPVHVRDGLTRSTQDEFAVIELVDSRRAVVRLDRDYTVQVEIHHTLREAISDTPHALWLASLSSEPGKSTVTPFAPPRSIRLLEDVPVLLPSDADVAAKLNLPKLRVNEDLATLWSVRLGFSRMAILGQNALDSSEEGHGSALTLWLPDGESLECVLEGEPGRARLRVVDAQTRRDSCDARCAPCVLVEFGVGVKLPLVSDDGSWANETATVPFRLPKFALFEAWGTYTAIERSERERLLEYRREHALEFERGRQKDGNWVCTAHFSSGEVGLAWFGLEEFDESEHKVDQRVVLRGGDGNEQAFVVRKGRLLDPRRAELTLEPNRGRAHLPEQGTLEARENPGTRIKEAREREAVEMLVSGAAACPALWEILSNPARATPAVIRELRSPPKAQLDSHQRRAVQAIVGCQDVVAIQGPPGTGKTTVIVEALRQLAAIRGERPVRILLSSVQNEAVRNLVERSSGSDGFVISYLRRESEDEEEARAFLESQKAQLHEVISSLERRYKTHEARAVITELDEAVRALSELRVLFVARPDDLEVLVERAQTFAASHASILGPDLVWRAGEFRKALPGEATEPANAKGGFDGPPRPEDAGEWWRHHEQTWPTELRARVAAAVAAVRSAVELPNGARREARVNRAWKVLTEALAAGSPTPAPEHTAVADSIRGDLGNHLGSWAREVHQKLAACRRLYEGTQEFAALRFLTRLRDDPSAWSSILARHALNTAATCSMAAKSRDAATEPFDWVIIDEAGRASPFELLIPAVHGRRVVLIGDHRQLPPTVDDAIARRANAESASDVRYETLFRSLFECLPKESRVRLATQYRMHARIGDLVNELFYAPVHEDLQSHFRGERAIERAPTFGVFDNQPVVWVDVPRKGAVSETVNDNEARYTIAVLREYAARGVTPESLAIIVPYTNQRELVTRLLREDPRLANFAARVLTFDAVQGREYPVVLVSTVRNDGSPGFMASPNRVNVAISRAQRQLIVLGNRESLESSRVHRRAPHLTNLAKRLRSFTRSVEVR